MIKFQIKNLPSLSRILIITIFFVLIVSKTSGVVIAYGDAVDCAQSLNSAACLKCVSGGGNFTTFGCIPGTQGGFVSFFLRIAVMLGGAISLLTIIYGGFLLLTSSGDPVKLVRGKAAIFSAVGGLLLVIFSLVILRVIGVDILGIPGA